MVGLISLALLGYSVDTLIPVVDERDVDFEELDSPYIRKLPMLYLQGFGLLGVSAILAGSTQLGFASIYITMGIITGRKNSCFFVFFLFFS